MPTNKGPLGHTGLYPLLGDDMLTHIDGDEELHGSG